MTSYQEMKVKELRIKGLGYKAIAMALDVDRDQVRYYCKKIGLTGTKEELAKRIQEEKEKGETCLYCGGILIRSKYAPKKKFCCEACRRAWWKEHPEKKKQSARACYVKACDHCGRIFISYGCKSRRFCSHDCYIRNRFWRDEDAV